MHFWDHAQQMKPRVLGGPLLLTFHATEKLRLSSRFGERRLSLTQPLRLTSQTRHLRLVRITTGKPAKPNKVRCSQTLASTECHLESS